MSDQPSTPTRSDPPAPAIPDAVPEAATQGPGAAELELALCRAALYSALAAAFRPPEPTALKLLSNAGALAALADAATNVEAGGGANRRDGGLAAHVQATARAGRGLEELACDYRRLFGHTVRGEAPLYETEYGEEALFQQPQELADLAGFARAFGLVLKPGLSERIDHVSCECEFMSFLARKQAYALTRGESEMYDTTSQAIVSFLRDHLGRFAPAFAHRLAKADADGFYGAWARLLAMLVNHDCARLGVEGGSQFLPLRPDPASVEIPAGCDGETQDGCGKVCKE